MKRFKWRLQKVLDVTMHTEEVLRSDLLAVSRRMAGLSQEISARRAMIAALLEELAQLCLQDRVARHELVMAGSQRKQAEIRQFADQLARCRRERMKKTEQLLKTRASRETLERLREEARVRYARAQALIEQKQFDESAQVAHARKGLGMDVSAAAREQGDE